MLLAMELDRQWNRADGGGSGVASSHLGSRQRAATGVGTLGGDVGGREDPGILARDLVSGMRATSDLNDGAARDGRSRPSGAVHASAGGVAGVRGLRGPIRPPQPRQHSREPHTGEERQAWAMWHLQGVIQPTGGSATSGREMGDRGIDREPSRGLAGANAAQTPRRGAVGGPGLARAMMSEPEGWRGGWGGSTAAMRAQAMAEKAVKMERTNERRVEEGR